MFLELRGRGELGDVPGDQIGLKRFVQGGSKHDAEVPHECGRISGLELLVEELLDSLERQLRKLLITNCQDRRPQKSLAFTVNTL